MEINEIYIKNFRNIGEEGAEIKLSPITIFTGCNSAGKSTAAKALILLEAYLSDVKKSNYNLIDTPLDFSKVVKFGTFDTILNSKAKDNGQEYFVLGYSFASPIIVADIQVRLTFVKRDSDALNNAWLQKLTVLIDSMEILAINVIGGHYNFEINNKEKFAEYIQYYTIRQIMSIWKQIVENARVEDPISYGEYDACKGKDLYKRLHIIEKEFVGKNVLRDILWMEDVDKILKKTLSKRDVISAIENIVSFSELDMEIYNCEVSKGGRLDDGDIEIISKKVIGDFHDKLKERNSEDFLKKIHKAINSSLEKKSLEIKKYIQDYISSDARTILEYKKGHNTSILQESLCSFNERLREYSPSNHLFGELIFDVLPGRSILVIKNLLNTALNPNICGRIRYVDSSTVEVRRLYPLDYSDRFGNLWKCYSNLADTTDEKGQFLRKWLQEFKICDDIIVENLEGAIRIKLISSINPEGRLLADYGYGVTQIIALLLHIEIAINRVEIGSTRYAGQDEDSDDYMSVSPSFLVIEEPEVHLHPSLQSRLADMFLDASRMGVSFIVETHSEYFVRRSQVIVASGFSKSSEYVPLFRVYYFPEDGKPYDMGFQKNGKFIENFGTGFFDVADNSAMDLFEFEEE